MFLSHKVLILNRNWMAINIVNLKRAITLLFKSYGNGEPKAHIVETNELNKWSTYTWSEWAKIRPENDECFITSVNAIYRVPKIIKLFKEDILPMKKIHFSRNAVFRRDKYICQYCSKQLNRSNCTLDHVIPRSKGGLTIFTNVCTCCFECNLRKGNKSLEQAGMHLLHKLKKPSVNAICIQDLEVESWGDFISSMYWNCELENDEDN